MENMGVPEKYISIIQVLNEDSGFDSWLKGLGNLPDNLRFMELHKISSAMKANNEDETVILFIEDLKKPRFYEAVLKTRETFNEEKMAVTRAISFIRNYFSKK